MIALVYRCWRCRALRFADYRDETNRPVCFACVLKVPVPADERPLTL